MPSLTAQPAADAVDLRWTQIPAAVAYELWVWWNQETGWQQLGSGDSLTNRTFKHAGVTAGTTYYYYIFAVNAAGEKSALPGAENAYHHAYATVPAPALPAPALTAQPAANAVDLSWTQIPAAVTYELWVWWNQETGWQQLGSGDSLTNRTFKHTGVTAGTTYYYTIRAVNAAGEKSAWPGAENAYHHADATVPE